MKILVTGARTFRDKTVIAKAFDEMAVLAPVYGGPIVVIHGGAPGADMLCELEAHRRGWHTARVKALWDFYGKPAGHIRNDVMNYLDPHECLAFLMPCEREDCDDPRPHITHGTADCMKKMRSAGFTPRECRDG